MARARGARLKREIAGGVVSGATGPAGPPGAGGGGAVTSVIRAICFEVSRLTNSVSFGPAATLRGPEPAGKAIGVVSEPSVVRRASDWPANWAIQKAPSVP